MQTKQCSTGHLIHCLPLHRPTAEMMLTSEDLLYEVNEVSGGSPFALTVKRRSTGDIIFDTTGTR
jgi:hypothetical protein